MRRKESRELAAGDDRLAERHGERAADSRTAERERYLAVLLDALPDGADVLELGCGTGELTTARLAERLRVIGVDASASGIELARRNVPGARFVRAETTSLALPPESFDAVAAFHSIAHVPRDEHAELLGAVATWLRPGGVFVASFWMGSGAAEGGEADGPGAPTLGSGHPPDVTQRLVREAGLEIVGVRVEVADEGGQPVPLLWIVARKPPS